mmetsp:Transcript_13873/g.24305  ORF Transcript_13873/g.24305 Transcript_13873/m.24305 type:complete len:200 (-) Transcript_13873:293-892(-)
MPSPHHPPCWLEYAVVPQTASPQTMPHFCSNEVVIRAKTYAADSGYSLTLMFWSTQGASMRPCAKAPTTNTIGLASGKVATCSCMATLISAPQLKPMRRQSSGKCLVTGPLITFKSLSGPLLERMLSFCSSCAIKPQKRRNVRGRRTFGLTEMSTFFCVRMNIPFTFPDLFKGESRMLSKAWWQMSGRYSAGSFLCLRR